MQHQIMEVSCVANQFQMKQKSLRCDKTYNNNINVSLIILNKY